MNKKLLLLLPILCLLSACDANNNKNIPDDEFVESEHFTELLEILDKVEENK